MIVPSVQTCDLGLMEELMSQAPNITNYLDSLMNEEVTPDIEMFISNMVLFINARNEFSVCCELANHWDKSRRLLNNSI